MAMATLNDDLEESIRRALPSALKMPLYTAKKQNYEILKYTIEGIDSLSANAAVMRDYADDSHLAALEATTREFVLLDAQLSAYKQQLEQLEAAIERGTLDPADVDRLMDAGTTTPTVNVTQHELYKRFCERAGLETGDDADEDVVLQGSESSRSTICPVTQLEIVEPLRNPMCGHTYSRQGIQSHLQRSRKCPVAGCPQKLTLASLERDVEMEVLIARRKNSSQQQHPQRQASAPSFRQDEDEDEEYMVE